MKCALPRCVSRSRKPPGLQLPDGFLLYRNYENGIFTERCSMPVIYHQRQKKWSVFARMPLKCLELPQKSVKDLCSVPCGHKKGTATPILCSSPFLLLLCCFIFPQAAPQAQLSGRAGGSPLRQRSRPRAARTGRWRSLRPDGRADSAAPARRALRFPADGR